MKGQVMNKAELFEKYNIDASHANWDHCIDNWMGVVIYQIMNAGVLPGVDNTDLTYICDFLDKRTDIAWWFENVRSRPNWGSLFLTAKRMVYRHSDAILQQLHRMEINQGKGSDEV